MTSYRARTRRCSASNHCWPMVFYLLCHCISPVRQFRQVNSSAERHGTSCFHRGHSSSSEYCVICWRVELPLLRMPEIHNLYRGNELVCRSGAIPGRIVLCDSPAMHRLPQFAVPDWRQVGFGDYWKWPNSCGRISAAKTQL